jgi:PEP-CTERM motif
MRRTLYFTLAMCFLAAPTFADTTCAAANFSNIIGTTCDIGPLQFQFTDIFAGENVTDPAGQVFGEITFTPSNFYFTPTSDGFTVTLLSGPQLITSSVGFHTGEDIFLFYTLVVQDPTLVVTSEIVSSPGLAVSGSDNSSVLVGDVQPTLFSCGGTRVQDSLGTITTTALEPCKPVLPLLPQAQGATVVFLGADNGNTVFWSGATNFTFPTEPFPEPSSLMLLGSGLLGLAGIVLFKRVRPQIWANRRCQLSC